jgi:hypothetical protein
MMKISLTLAVILLAFYPGQALGDTLILQDGTSISGSLVRASSHVIEFQDDLGMSHVFKRDEIRELRLSGKKNTAQGRHPQDQPANESELIKQLLQRVERLESAVNTLKSPPSQQAAATSMAPSPVMQPAYKEVSLSAKAENPAPAPTEAAQNQEGHTMEIPGFGPALKIRGFLDLNFGLGDVANPLRSPLGAPGHATFQAGQFDLFITSKLSDTLEFLSEFVVDSDETNQFGLDIERYVLQYRPNDYFQIAAGRFHTAIGYYNTAFHHGTWFQKATGRPFLFLFEDSGGILPVHTVGISTTGLVPGTGKLNLHWIAEVGNGRRSNPNDQPVQNFLSDKDHKAFNLAFYVKPDWIPGAQFGASYYRDRLVPIAGGLPTHVNQSITSAHAVYTNNNWEFFNEAVLIRNQADGQSRVLDTPGFYSQLARRLAKNYWPYFRYQYVNVPKADLVNPAVGRQDGPSAGIRWDFTNYAALKLQYNRVYQRGVETKNGLDTQLAFTF